MDETGAGEQRSGTPCGKEEKQGDPAVAVQQRPSRRRWLWALRAYAVLSTIVILVLIWRLKEEQGTTTGQHHLTDEQLSEFSEAMWTRNTANFATTTPNDKNNRALNDYQDPPAPGSCQDYPKGWIDSSGDDCAWYALNENCRLYGGGYTNFGTTANQACCDCQVDGVSGGCYDDPPEWHDSLGTSRTCAFYEFEEESCEHVGGSFVNQGKTANQACCVCGGGCKKETRQEVFHTELVHRRVQGPSASNVEQQCNDDWHTCFFGPMPESQATKEYELQQEYGGYWKCTTDHITTTTGNNGNHAAWCEHNAWNGGLCYMDCYAGCEYTLQCLKRCDAPW